MRYRRKAHATSPALLPGGSASGVTGEKTCLLSDWAHSSNGDASNSSARLAAAMSVLSPGKDVIEPSP